MRFGYPFSFSGPSPRRTISTPLCDHCYLSSTTSPLLMTMSTAPELIFSIFPGRQGFVLHIVTVASSALSHQYYPWICHPLPLIALGSPLRFGLLSSLATIDDRAGGLPWVRRTTSPYPVQLHVGLLRRISGLALSRLLDLRPNTI